MTSACLPTSTKHSMRPSGSSDDAGRFGGACQSLKAHRPSGDKGDLSSLADAEDMEGISNMIQAMASDLRSMRAQVYSQLLETQTAIAETDAKVNKILQASLHTDKVLQHQVRTSQAANGEGIQCPSEAGERGPRFTYSASMGSMDVNVGDAAESSERPGLRRSNSVGTRSTNSSGGSSLRDVERLRNLVLMYETGYQGTRSVMSTRIWIFLEDRMSSKWAYRYSYLVPFTILVSVLISFAQTTDDLALPRDVTEVIQTAFEAAFALELIVRLVVCPDRFLFWFDPFNIIDLVSALPIIARLILMTTPSSNYGDSIDIIAFVPMLRLLKMLRRFHKFHLLVSAFKIAVEALPVLVYALMLLALGFAAAIFLTEPREVVPSLPKALWFVIVTVTTVGYGDMHPTTVAGHCVTTVLMIVGVLYMAVPIGIVGNAFSQVWDDRDRLLLVSAVRERFHNLHFSTELVRDMFRLFTCRQHPGRADDFENSLDSELELGFAEFRKLMRALLGNFFSEERLMSLFECLDIDGGGSISCEEFLQKLFPSYSLQKLQEAYMKRTITLEESAPTRSELQLSPPPQIE